MNIEEEKEKFYKKGSNEGLNKGNTKTENFLLSIPWPLIVIAAITLSIITYQVIFLIVPIIALLVIVFLTVKPENKKDKK